MEDQTQVQTIDDLFGQACSSRRRFLQTTLATLIALSVPACASALKVQTAFQGADVFDRILSKATSNGWSALPIGDLIGKIAEELKGTPYKANTLELSTKKEICSVNFTALDCVTFYETSLCFARMLKKGGHTPADLLAEIAFVRYRNGKPGDYSTRLHYTTDWFADNQAKHVVKMLFDLPGAETVTQKVSIMSEHPESSPQLVALPKLVPIIKNQESAINQRSMKFIPINKIAEIEPLLKTGDIVGICTSIPGLDVAHTGLVFRRDDGVAHFMDATSRKNKMMVTIEEGPICQALGKSKQATGAIFARPLELQTHNKFN